MHILIMFLVIVGSTPTIPSICRHNSMGECFPYLINLLQINMNTKELGNLTELQCITRLYELGCSVSIPFGNSDKYDLIIDVNNKLYKVQIKHSKTYPDGQDDVEYIKFKCVWQRHNANGYSLHQYKPNEIDFFATFYQGECYLIPQKECSNEKVLRIIPPKNGQLKGVSFLNDYKAEEVLKQL